MIAIIDYDAGNIKSVEKAFQYIGEDTVVSRDKDVILSADKVVLPGVGSFGDAMEKLRDYDLIDTINKVVEMCIRDSEPIELSFKEFELLSYFIQNKGIALSRENILNNVWNYDYFGDARTIDTHVKKLRNKLGECGKYIVTIWGMGYKFEVN